MCWNLQLALYPHTTLYGNPPTYASFGIIALRGRREGGPTALITVAFFLSPLVSLNSSGLLTKSTEVLHSTSTGQLSSLSILYPFNETTKPCCQNHSYCILDVNGRIGCAVPEGFLIQSTSEMVGLCFPSCLHVIHTLLSE